MDFGDPAATDYAEVKYLFLIIHMYITARLPDLCFFLILFYLSDKSAALSGQNRKSYLR
jgi:hypothetical protein